MPQIVLRTSKSYIVGSKLTFKSRENLLELDQRGQNEEKQCWNKNNIGACIVRFVRQVYFQSFVSHANKVGVRVNMSSMCMNPSSSCWYVHCQPPPSNMGDRRLGKLLLLLNFRGYFLKNLEGYVFLFLLLFLYILLLLVQIFLYKSLFFLFSMYVLPSFFI